MKALILRVILTSAVALLGFASTTLAWTDKGCKDSTLEGDYGFTVSGTIFLPGGVTVLREGIALTHFDGKGNLHQEDYVLSNGVLPPGPTDASTGFHTDETGTYTVNPDCTGTAEIDTKALDPSGNVVPGPVIKLKFVLSNHGNAIHTVVSSLTLPSGPVPAAIRSDGYKIGKLDD
jgi:hypothetical protein